MEAAIKDATRVLYRKGCRALPGSTCNVTKVSWSKREKAVRRVLSDAEKAYGQPIEITDGRLRLCIKAQVESLEQRNDKKDLIREKEYYVKRLLNKCKINKKRMSTGKYVIMVNGTRYLVECKTKKSNTYLITELPFGKAREITYDLLCCIL